MDGDGFDGDASSTRTRSPARNRSRGPVQIVENDGSEVTRMARPLMPPPRPVFCWLAICMCTGTFILQIQQNGWMFQPFTCPTTCAGAPCNDDGSPCESNFMLGPSVAVLDRMGAKNDPAIFERGEWWRVLACARPCMSVSSCACGRECTCACWLGACARARSGRGVPPRTT